MTVDTIKTNLEMIQQRINTACEGVGRKPADVTLLPVSKTKPSSDIRTAFAAGLKRFGENKVQEARQKAEETVDLPIDWCVIGHLQSNKAKYVAQFAAELHSLDSLKLARELDKRLQQQGRKIDVLIQVNTSAEPQKYGLMPAEVLSFAKQLEAFTSLNVKGLMTLALFSADEAKVRPCFVRLRELREQLRQDAAQHGSWQTLSMGMSGDFEIAIKEGATEVRVGQAIFGKRPLPDSHYWPE